MKVRKTTGAGPLGRLTGALGRSWRYTRITKRERRMRLIGEAIVMLEGVSGGVFDGMGWDGMRGREVVGTDTSAGGGTALSLG